MNLCLNQTIVLYFYYLIILLASASFYFALNQSGYNILSLHMCFRIPGWFHVVVDLCSPLCVTCSLINLHLVVGIELLFMGDIGRIYHLRQQLEDLHTTLFYSSNANLKNLLVTQLMIFGSKMKRIGGNILVCNGFKKEIVILISFIRQPFNKDNAITLIVFYRI